MAEPPGGEGREPHARDVACVIVGAGPAGLATAACLRDVGVPFLLLDRTGVSGGAYRDIYDGVTLASPAVLDGLPGLALKAAAPYVTVPEYRAYLRHYAAHHRLEVTRAQVEMVGRVGGAGDAFLIRLGGNGGELRARFVVAATGMWNWPVRPPLPDHERCPVPVLHAKDWRGPGAAGGAGTRLLIVGGATSAVELAEEAARAEMTVTVSVRGKLRLAPETVLGRDVHHYVGPLERLPPWLARGYCARRPTLPGTDRGFSRLRAAGRITVRPGIARLGPHGDGGAGGSVTFADGTSAAFDRIVTATGYRFETPYLPSEVERAPAGHVVARHNESRSWPGLFVVGAPCANRLDSEFLRGVARDAPLVARAIAARL